MPVPSPIVHHRPSSPLLVPTSLKSMPTFKRKNAYRASSASDDSSEQLHQVKLIVVDRGNNGRNTHTAVIPPIRLPPMRLPPHKDWYTMKPIPRAPLPLYHPLRVVKPRPPPPMSTALPLTRLINQDNNNNSNNNGTATRSSARNRRPPLKLREVGGGVGTEPTSPTSSNGELVVVEQPKPRRQRRTKAEIAAANAAAAAAAAATNGVEGENTTTVAPRRKRKRAEEVVQEVEDVAANTSANVETATTNGTPKRRRRANANIAKADTEVTSNYGTRSRTINGKAGGRSGSASDDVSVVDEQHDVAPSAKLPMDVEMANTTRSKDLTAIVGSKQIS